MSRERYRDAAEQALLTYAQRLGRTLAQHAPEPPPGQSGYLCSPCEACGVYRLRRTGSCAVCENCGSSAGCS